MQSIELNTVASTKRVETRAKSRPEASRAGLRALPRVAMLCVLASAGTSAMLAASGTVAVYPPWVNVGVSTTQQFVATVGGAIQRSSSSSLAWSINGVPGGNSTLGTISASGLYTAPSTPPSRYSLSVTATNTANSAQSYTSSLWVFTGVVLNVYPKVNLINPGQSVQLYSTISGTTNTSVLWRVQGGSVNGTVSSTGVYTAPATAPSGIVYVICQSTADLNKTDTAQIGVIPGSANVTVNVTPSAATLSPGQTQQLTAAVTGSSNTAVTWSLSPAIGTISSTGLYTAPSSLATQTTITATAASVASPGTTDTASLTLLPSAAKVTVAINPAGKNLDATQTQQFSATVTGTTNTSVAWSLSPSVGTISSSGLYTAPASVSAPQTIAVTATSAASSTATASAALTIYPAVSITSGTTPNGTVSSPYSAALTVAGGLAPYTWGLSAGVLPAGISLSNSGVLAGSPTTSGSFNFTVNVTDANGMVASKALGLTVAPVSTGGLTVLTNSLAMGSIGQAYTASLKASGGTPPYKWTLSSGTLPSGVTFSQSTGQLSGTPTQSGPFTLTFGVQDSKTSTGSKTFTWNVFEQPQDQYGGFTSLPCSKGAQAHFYTQKIGSRWHLCTPAGNAFWMNSIYNVDASDSGTDYQGVVLANLANSKYQSGYSGNATLNWALQTVRRMQSWGFNSLAEYANGWTLPVAVNNEWPTSDYTIPVKLPFVGFAAATAYSMTNSGNYASQPVKDLMAGVKTTVYTNYRSQAADYWDPNFAQWLKNDVAADSWIQQGIKGPHNEYLIAFAVDDTDYLQGFGAGPDFPTVAYGMVSPGYDQPHLGWVILVTAPTQSSNSSQGVTYATTTVYAKQKLSSWLSTNYGGSIAKLNTAWGSKYTTFGSAGGWGTGTGLLDEDGTCPAKGSGPCWVPTDAFRLAGATSQMQSDLDAFLLLHAQNYFSTIKGILQAAMPGVLYAGPTSLGTWGTPPRRQVLQAASQYVDLLGLATMPPLCSNCTDLQQRVDFVTTYAGDKPWISWEGFPANADSYMSPFATPQDEFTTQAARGAAYQQRIQQLLGAADSTTGTYHLVGFQWWDLYDMRGESTNWGMLTPRDDAYDGVSATKTAGADSWGYPTGCLTGYGCEQGNYGNFITPVTNGNLTALRTIASGK